MTFAIMETESSQFSRKQKMKDLKEIKNNLKQNILTTGLLGGILFPILYASGYFYLISYFGKLGQLIPVNDLPPIEIALLGFPPFLIFFAIILIFYFLYRRILRNQLISKILIKRNFDCINLLNQSWIKGFIGLLLLIIFYFSVYSYSKLIVKNNLPYNNLFGFGGKMPIVQVIYITPLIDVSAIQKVDESESEYCEYVLVEEFVSGGIKFENKDNYFEDAFGIKRFIGNFIFYFESNENYYFKPLNDFSVAKNEIFITNGICIKEDGTEKKFESKLIGDVAVNFFHVFVLPKNKVESIKYTELNIENQKKYSYRDLFKL